MGSSKWGKYVGQAVAYFDSDFSVGEVEVYEFGDAGERKTYVHEHFN